MFTTLLAASAGSWLGTAVPSAQAQGSDPECERSGFTGLVSAAAMENQAQQAYLQLKRDAQSKNQLAAASDPQLERLRYIAGRIIPLTVACNPRAREWRWEVQLLRNNALNAFCMPGGKIAFFSGILSRLKLSDDEVAVIMGHETAHALLEHAREQMGKSGFTNVGLRLLAAVLGLGNVGDLAAQATAKFFSLKYGRQDELQADGLGLLLAARAGYDPRAGVSLWKKMAEASGGRAPPAWLSTHPPGPERIRDIERRLPRALPEFQRAALPERRFPVATQ